VPDALYVGDDLQERTGVRGFGGHTGAHESEAGVARERGSARTR
jgi:hypothetical protein